MLHRWHARITADAAKRAIASRLNADRLDLSLAVTFSKSLSSKDPLLQIEEDDDDARVNASYFILNVLVMPDVVCDVLWSLLGYYLEISSAAPPELFNSPSFDVDSLSSWDPRPNRTLVPFCFATKFLNSWA